MSTTATSQSVIGGFAERPIDERAALISIYARSDEARVHYQTLNDGSWIVALQLGALNIHFSLQDAQSVGALLAGAGAAAETRREELAA